MASDTFYDRLVAKADERRRKREQEVRQHLYGGKASDLSTEIDRLNDEEEAFYKQMEKIGSFGRASFVPLGKTQRSLDESADSDGDGGLTERDGHSHRGEEASPSSHQAEEEDDEDEDEDGSELVGGDLDAEIEDMDNPSRSGGEEAGEGFTDQSGEGFNGSAEL